MTGFVAALLDRRSVLLGLAAVGVGCVSAGALGAISPSGPTSAVHAPANDVNWMVAEHPAAPPYFDTARNLNLGSTPTARCGKGSRPETSWQGRVPAKDYTDGRAAKGYTCNTVEVSHFGKSGGYRVARYVDKHHHVCAFYDSTLLFPADAAQGNPPGTYVLDMTDPRHPAMTANLTTPAMDTPHESLRLNTRSGLLVSDAGSPATQVGVVDVYSVADDCRHPVFESSLPIGPLGHESGFSPDGKTFWATATAREGITAIDLTNPALPRIIWHTETYGSHGMAISPDGNRAYLASPCCNYFTAISGFGNDSQTGGLIILDISKIQNRTISSPLKLLFLAHVFGIRLDIPQLAAFLALQIALSFSTAGIPSMGTIRSIPAYVAVGIPLEGVVILDAMEAIPDVFKTVINVTADMSVATILSRRERAAAVPVPVAFAGAEPERIRRG